MADVQAMDIDTDTTEQEILLAATNHDLDSLRRLLRTPKGSANVVDSDTGMTPLHAAIAACEPDEDTAEDKKDMDVDEAATLNDSALEEDEALKTVKLLLENGAIWNDLDDNNETPGCLALRLGLKKCYEAMVEAGIRAELLLSRLDGFEMLAQYEDDSEDEEQEEEGFEIIENENGDSLQASMVEIEESAPELVGADGMVPSTDSVPELVQIDENGQETKVDVNSEDSPSRATDCWTPTRTVS
jgi:protein arginine N-methyltransferase 2